MAILIFFDTNFIFSNRFKFDFIDKLKELNIEMFSSELVKNEMKGKKRRTITKVLTELISIVSRAKNFIDLEYNKGTFINDTNIIDSYKKSDENIDDFFKDTFGDKMIPLLDNQKMIDTLYERNKIKIPPFNDGDSDKGFMDTLIWICFLEYCKINTYDRYVFITNDEDFNNHTSTLEEEFNTLITNGNIEIKKFNSGFEVL